MRRDKAGNTRRGDHCRILRILLVCFVLAAASAAAVYADQCPEGGEHDYKVKLVRQATNTKDGLRVYTCTKCGDSYEEVIESFAHHWSKWKIVTAPQCDRTGVEERHCTKCGAREQRKVDSLGHDWGEWHTEGAIEVRVCKRDPAHRQERAVAAEEAVPEEPAEESPREEAAEKPAAPTPQETSRTAPEDPAVWTKANTAVAAGGGLVLLGLGSQLYLLYITPWLWIAGKRRRKRKEMERRMLG